MSVLWVLLIVAITVRSKKHEKILRKEWEDAQKQGVDFSKVEFRGI
jgi:hypothetical protein